MSAPHADEDRLLRATSKPSPQQTVLAIVVAVAIVAVGFVVGYFIWRWADGRQMESFPIFLAIFVPQTASISLAWWARDRVRGNGRAG